jgi:hypothetical protein
MPGEPSRRRSGRSHEALGNERPRGMAITAPGLFQGAGQNPAYTPSGTFSNLEHFMNFITVIMLFVIGVRAATTCSGRDTPKAGTSEIYGFIYKTH